MTGCWPFFEEHGVPLLRILTDRGSEYCGNRETHEYALYLDLENIEHTRTKTRQSADQRHLRALPPDDPERVLRERVRTPSCITHLRSCSATSTSGWKATMPSGRNTGSTVYGKTPLQTFHRQREARVRLETWLGSSRHPSRRTR